MLLVCSDLEPRARVFLQVVLLTGVDRLTRQAQSALRRTMEKVILHDNQEHLCFFVGFYTPNRSAIDSV